MHEIQSNLPIIALAAPLVCGVLVALMGTSQAIRAALAAVGALVPLVVSGFMAEQVLHGRVLTAWGSELRVDGLSVVMVAIISLVAVLAALYSVRYMMQSTLLGRIGGGETIEGRRLQVFYALFLFFVFTMLWGCVTNNIVMLYVAVEATTIASGLLVAFYWDRRGLEAGYKYLMLLTVGITFALFGCVLVYAGASAAKLDGRPFLHGGEALMISKIKGGIFTFHELGKSFFPTSIALVAVACFIVGFGTKAGIAPFHPWLPDAHAEAPTPVSALLSGVMIKMAAYALARTVTMFYPAYSAVSTFVLILACFTMLLGVLMTLVQDDLKRMLAYSSVGQIGYVVMGFGLGTYLGVYSSVFHLVNHAIYKSLLFMGVGAVIYATRGERKMSALGGLGRKMPITAACFFIGALAISGMPPFNGFVSKLSLYLAAADAGRWWACIIGIGAGIFTLVALVHVAYAVFWGEARSPAVQNPEVREVPATMWFPMVVLAGLCIILGVYPQLIYPLLDHATKALRSAF